MSESASISDSSGRDRIPPQRRDEALERDGYTCMLCPAAGPAAGGTAELEVHHADPDPDDGDRHALSNLVTLCKDCHLWHHKRPDGDDVPLGLTTADDEVLDATDYEIVRYLAENGPATTSEVVDALTPDLSPTAVRERLTVLMGLDTVVDGRDRQLIDQDVDTGVWGLPGQVEQSKRGYIPSDEQTLIQRIEEEQVRKAMARGYDKHTVADVLDISPRTVVHKQKRARAYRFPLDAFRRGGNGGQHPAGSPSSNAGDEATEAGEAAEQPDGTDSGDEAGEDVEQGDADGVGDAARRRGDAGGEVSGADDGDDIAVQEQLQAAITALQRVNAEL